MYRVLLVLLTTAIAVQISGCTGTLRLGSEIPTVSDEHIAQYMRFG